MQIFHPSTSEQIFYEGQAKDVEVILGKTNNLNIKLKRLKQNWVIDLTPVIDFTILDENPWGTSGITDYQSDSFNITDMLSFR